MRPALFVELVCEGWRFPTQAARCAAWMGQLAGAKARHLFGAVYGPTKVVPLLESWRLTDGGGFCLPRSQNRK